MWQRLGLSRTEVDPLAAWRAVAPATGPFLGVEGLGKAFGPVQALDQVSLEIPRGVFAALLGPSGCGKTTLLRILAGLETPDTGRVLLDGRPLHTLPAHQRPVNTVFQSYALFPHLSVFENIAFGLRARGLPEDQLRERVADGLALVHLEEQSARLPHQLSGGQKQRVALARALVNEPLLLLLDEPLSALDARLRAEMQLELRQLQQRLGTTFLLVTHDQAEAMSVADLLFVMEEGRIAQSGAPAEVYEKPRTRFVAQFLGSANLIEARRNGQAQGVDTALGPLTLRQPPPWEAGTLAIRPERIEVCNQAPGLNGIAATVSDWVYRGDHCEVMVEPGSLRLRTAPSPHLARGQSLWLHLPPQHLEALHG
ncbi:MAG: ABC transporter ATP-binding protein [Candidatus Handelsmanbacteria bacterium]|nr:ABC transporter ATP-binding protein [Candidatus Handelsmanbacteria bacterium]